MGRSHVVSCFLRGVVYLLGTDVAISTFEAAAENLRRLGMLEDTENQTLE